MRTSSAIFLACCAIVTAAMAQTPGFKFSNPSPEEQAQQQADQSRRMTIDMLLATPCAKRLKNRKIMVLVGEEKNGMVAAQQGAYSRHVDAINARLKMLGLKTYSPEEIRKQVAQEEVDAYFKNDPDRALSASKRLAAQYVLKGVIATQATYNRMVNVNQVNVAMDFTLTDAAGRPVSKVRETNASYAGADVSGMALKLIEEKADDVVAQLYADYCSTAR
ncbi:MAG TPA: hypothetical protein VIE63_01650 [Ramlibacter sp.]|jgi:hypothetical protein